jgi:ubiquinone/menaquinone biosynthesis C-methylase UbiE
MKASNPNQQDSLMDEHLRHRILLPRDAYNLASESYDDWPWQQFWRHNEVPVVVSLFGELNRSSKILDIGAGTGYYIDQLSRNGAEVVGLDVSEGMLRQARKRLGLSARLVQGDACDLPFADDSFDAVLATRVFSHIPELARPLSEIRRVLRLGGALIVSDIDPAHDYETTKVPTAFGKVKVRTVKRALEELALEAAAVGFELEKWQVLHARNVAWTPIATETLSIDLECDRPIGYVTRFRLVNNNAVGR